MNISISNHMIGMAGEYYVCAELCRRNILALVTPKNNPLFDVVATDPNGERAVSIQVKTMSLQNVTGWKVSKEMCTKSNNPNLFVVLVNLKADGTNDFYVYEQDRLAERIEMNFSNYMSLAKKNGDPRKDPGFRWFDFRDFQDDDRKRLDAWHILGFEANG
jgi:hypothetical protein